MTEQLENKWSGQGHRAELARKRQYDSRWEEVQNRYGEERAMYVRNRDASGSNNYTASHPPSSGQDRFAQNVLGRREATPRSMPNSSLGNTAFMNRGRGPVPAPVNPNRAPSPRQFGTVRISGGKKRDENRPPSSTTTSRPVAAKPAVPAPANTSRAKSATSTEPASATTAPHVRPTTKLGPAGTLRAASVQSGRTTSPTAKGHSRPTASAATNGAGTPASTRPSTPKPLPRASFDWSSSFSEDFLKALASAAVAQGTDDFTTKVIKIQALSHAAQPGPKTDAYYAEFPRRLHHLHAAQRYLITSATRLADKSDDSPAVISFLERGPNREWMLRAAREAKIHARQFDEKVDAFYQQNPEKLDFLLAATAMLRDQPHAAPAVGAVQNRVGEKARSAPAMSANQNDIGDTTRHARPTPSVTSSTTTDPITETNEAARKKLLASYKQMQLPGAFPADTADQPTIAITNGTSASAHSGQSTDTPNTNGIHVTTTVEQQTSPASAAMSKSPDGSVKTVITAPPPSSLGTLTLTVMSYLSKILDVRQLGLSVPVDVSLTVTSRSAAFDPKQLIGEIETLAKNMRGRTLCELEGVRKTEDGLYVEESE